MMAQVQKVLVVVDMQNDFIDGSLGSIEAVKVTDNAAAKIKNFTGNIFATLDTHYQNYLDTAEGRKLPVEHCIYKTYGWRLHEKILNALYNKPYKTVEKETFGSTKLVKENNENELIDFSVMANGKIAAGTYYYDFLPGGENDFLKYGNKEKNPILDNVTIPTLVIFGDKDDCVLTEPIEVVKNYLIENIKNCHIEIIEGANHSYTNKGTELEKIIKHNF